jgi:hypothetical protein
MKYDYEEINERSHPVISGILAGPSRSENFSFIVDTVFEGNILIRRFHFEK